MMLKGHVDELQARPWATALILAAVFAVIRFIHLAIIDTSVGADEAQYWFWSREFDFGYYSKPPMIGWVIGLTTTIFGDNSFGVRAASPLFLAATGIGLFATARALFGTKPAFVTLIFWNVAPVVIYGGSLMSTDIPTLCFYSFALFSLVKLIEAVEADKWKWAARLGFFAGLGMMSKYAAVYFFPGLALALVSSDYVRRGVRIKDLALAGGVFLLVFSPNLIWNFANGLQTVKHTADNANLTGELFQPEELIDFLVSQFGVVGPLLFGTLVFGLVRHRFEGRGKEAMLVSFILPPLLIISAQAFLSRAHANWAVTAYIPALVLLPVWLERWKILRPVFALTLVLQLGVAFAYFYLSTDLDRAESMGASNAAKRVRAWDETAALVQREAESFTGIVTDEREWTAHLVWELRDTDVRITVFDENERTDSTYEYAMPYDPQPGERWLLVTRTPEKDLSETQASLRPRLIKSVLIDLHAKTRGQPERTVHFYEIGTGPVRDLPSEE